MSVFSICRIFHLVQLMRPSACQTPKQKSSTCLWSQLGLQEWARKGRDLYSKSGLATSTNRVPDNKLHLLLHINLTDEQENQKQHRAGESYPLAYVQW